MVDFEPVPRERKNRVFTAEKPFRYQLKDGSWFIIKKAVLSNSEQIFQGIERKQYILKYCVPYDESSRPKDDENIGLLFFFPKFIRGNETYHSDRVKAEDSVSNGNIEFSLGRPKLNLAESMPNWLNTDYYEDPDLEVSIFNFAVDFLEEIIEKKDD